MKFVKSTIQNPDRLKPRLMYRNESRRTDAIRSFSQSCEWDDGKPLLPLEKSIDSNEDCKTRGSYNKVIYDAVG